MKNLLYLQGFAAILMLSSLQISAQVSVNNDGTPPVNSAMLQVKSTEKGFLPPCMTSAQRDAIVSPASGLMIFNTDCNDINLYDGIAWVMVTKPGWLQNPDPINGNNTPCPNATGEVYSVNAVPEALAYTWTVPLGATITSGQGTTSITVNFGATNGAISVMAYNKCYKSPTVSMDISLGLIDAPVANSAISSQTVIVWKCNSVNQATGYKWNTENNYNNATDLGTDTLHIETNLTCNTTYTRYFWAYKSCTHSLVATTTQTTTICLTPCPSTPVVQYGGQYYDPVLIGTQCWFAQNMNIGIRIVNNQAQSNNSMIEKYCYDDDEHNCDIYGGLYLWDETMQYETAEGAQGICPSGWHVPTQSEYTTLWNFLGATNRGGKMKEVGTEHWWSPNTGASNSSGFTALPGGRTSGLNYFISLHEFAFLLTSSQQSGMPMFMKLMYDSGEFQGGYSSNAIGYSVRCLKN
jgi:uncharacterized protein (TIGR02145 family)